MKIVLAGGSGQVGGILRRAFAKTGDEVVVLTRRPGGSGDVPWDGKTTGPWTAALEGCDVLVNLAGRSVNCRYHAANRAEILQSRVGSTRILGETLGGLRNPPPVWLQASTATIYRHTFGAPEDEANGVLGGGEPGVPRLWDFSIDVARRWEQEALRFRDRTRLVLLRSAMTMSPDRDGVFDTLWRLVRLGLGGTIGSGRQFVSWIHEEDFVAAMRWLIAREDIDGPVNLCSPNPLPNRDFMRGLRRAARRPMGLPAGGWILELGAFVMRTETELVLKSRRVVPGRLAGEGFGFQYPTWETAARELCARRAKM